MKVKRVPLQDLELWPDEVICFTAYTDTRNPVQQRRTYVDGEKLKAENAELRELLGESLMDYKLYAKKYGLPPYLSDVNEHLDARLRELGIEVPE